MVGLVILSEAKDLSRWAQRCFAEFTLERSEGLSMTLPILLGKNHNRRCGHKCAAYGVLPILVGKTHVTCKRKYLVDAVICRCSLCKLHQGIHPFYFVRRQRLPLISLPAVSIDLN
jgi:hypothetical protein